MKDSFRCRGGKAGSGASALTGLLIAVAVLACESSPRAPAPADPDVSVGLDRRTDLVAGPCPTGEVRECSITLSQHDGVLNCYHGQQVCTEGIWGRCGSGEVTSLPAPAPAGEAPGSRLLAITGAEVCISNPCDPYCLELAAEDGTSTSIPAGDLSNFDWQTGTLSSFPSGLVKKGLHEPCASGADCQFNTRCQYPVSTGCDHDKCSTGGALESTCDDCVGDICAADPTCCVDTPTVDPVCTHDPCSEGAALDASCDSCVTAICMDMPTCCSGTWDAACTAAVVTVCGNICSCRAGEVAYDGACYFKEEADKNWTASRTSCQGRGSRWDLLSVDDSAENAFVVSRVIDDSETWIGLTDGNSIGTDGRWKWASGNPSGTWIEAATPLVGVFPVINFGSAWSYNATNVNPGATWNQIGFNATSWPSGNGQLGFGESDQATTFVRNGPSYYFRRIVNLPKKPIAATVDLIFDDGFLVYVNGTEVLRNNVPDATHASFASSSTDNATTSSAISASPFVVGNNVIAVLVKDRGVTAHDLSFDLKLAVTYGPDRVISYGDDWSYYAAAADPGASWAAPDFNDSSWLSGPSQLGFGEGDEATAFTKTGASYYFRRVVTLAETINDASLTVLYDDGYVAFVNGVEVARRNVADLSHVAFSSGTADNDEQTTAIATSPFVVGDNVIAIVVKNTSAANTDLSFNAQLDVTLSGSSLYENFPSGEPDAEACTIYSANRVGTWADKRCNQNTDSVCEGPPTQMTGGGGVPLSGAWTAIDYGASWKYRNNGVDPGSSWTGTAFDDAAWTSGPAQLGFGDGDEATAFTANNPTYYFRRTVNVPTEISDATLSMVYDDGFVAYVNGVEVLRRNVPGTTHASYATSASGDNEALTVSIPTSAFVVGPNTIAVMVKNANGSSDVSFDLKLQVTLCGGFGCPPEPQWSQACIDKVGSVCDAQCDTRSPPRTTGQCVAWFPGETDPSCVGVDLAVGVPCDDNIPVCNHGTSTAPAGLNIVHFPANSQQYPACSPNLAHPQMKQCSTTVPIPPGECVNVTGCPGLTGNREIMINPTGPGYVAECSCQDNWSLYSGGECGEPTCDGGSSVATLERAPVDIIFIIDNSGSMAGEIAQVQDRINEDFAAIIESSGVDYRVIMMARYGSLSTAVGGSDYPICVKSPLGGHDCSNPISQGIRHNPPHFYHFSTDVGSTDGLCRILQGFNNKDELASSPRTPWTSVAPTGYQTLLRANARKAFVVITDDQVNCSYGGYTFNDASSVAGGQSSAALFDTALLTLSPAQFGTAADRNYVFHSIVAMSEFVPGTQPWPASQPIKTGMCTPGSEAPGTGYQGLSILTGGLRYPTCRNSDFNAIFQALAEDVVEGATVSCTVAIGANDDADPDKTTVRFIAGGSTVPTTFSRVSNAAACVNNAYYYEDATTITLCPTTCTMVQADLAGSLGVEVGCTGSGGYTARVMSERYQSECNEDTRVQWGFFTYNTTTPGNSNVQFRIRMADTEAGLDTATWIPLASAQASPDTQVCGFGGPEPCPIDMYTVLNPSGAAHLPFAEVEVILNPSSDGAQPSAIQGWQLNYSCPFSQ